MSKEKNLELERLIFFSDAVVAIAITLLALDLKIEKTDVANLLSFTDLGHLWTKFSAFFLSFILIAVFWKVHYQFFGLIIKTDGRLFWYNVFWLMFIITLPFATTLVSSYFSQRASILVYSVNTLMITIFQNQIWDHAAVRPGYLNEKATPELVYDYRFECNVAMFNAVLASIISFFSPLTAFIVLFTRPFMSFVLKKIFKRIFKPNGK